jgi:UDP-N-acetylmuramoyl-tripeptide--D-alanyl-D-alanine ligase
MITRSEIIQVLSSTSICVGQSPITEAVIDSRQVIPGALFIALEGEQTDGHLYLENAFNQGAQAAIISKQIPNCKYPIIDLGNKRAQDIDLNKVGQPFCLLVKNGLESIQKLASYWRNELDVRVIGITGSVGKSSTKELITEVLSQKFSTFKNPGNYNNEIGLPLTILNLGKGYQKLVLEMGFYYPGEISFLCKISKPHVGVITNIGTVHAERAGSKEAIALGKSELVQSLPPTPTGTAILNYDDPYVRAMAEKTAANILFYGLDPDADIWADEIVGLGLKGIKFCLHWKNQKVTIQASILGRHSVQTILRAASAGIIEGMTLNEIQEAIRLSNAQLRLVAVRTDSGALVLDDTYNATPESTIAALDLLNELEGQKIAVLGDMLELGKYEELGHVQVGEKAALVVNHLIAVGERGRIIADTARKKGLSPASISYANDALQAVELLRYNLKSDDVVLVKGSHGLRMDRIATNLEAHK